MNLVDTVSIASGSAILLGLLVSVAVDRIKIRFKGKRLVSAVDSKWQRLKVEVPA